MMMYIYMTHILKYNSDNMKINKYNSFINENIRDDEYSYLNDKLDLNSRWDDSSYDPYEDEGFYNDSEDEDDNYENEDMDHLLYLLRKMFNNSGIDNVEITNKKMDLTIYVELRSREKLRDIIKVFEVVNKLKKDILPQYDSEFDMWKTKKGSPLLTFNFYYDEGLDDDNVPF
jgi:hypothetical protein